MLEPNSARLRHQYIDITMASTFQQLTIVGLACACMWGIIIATFSV